MQPQALPYIISEIKSVAALPGGGSDLVLAPASAAEARAFVPLHSLPARLGGQLLDADHVEGGAREAPGQQSLASTPGANGASQDDGGDDNDAAGGSGQQPSVLPPSPTGDNVACRA